jgi:hypothetical protein
MLPQATERSDAAWHIAPASHRRLAVGSGHPSTRARHAARLAGEDLPVADHLDPAAERGAKDRLAQRKARTRNDRVHAFQERRVEGAEAHAKRGELRAERSQGRRRRSRVGRGEARAAPRQPTNRRKPRVTQAENEDALSAPFHIRHLSAI